MKMRSQSLALIGSLLAVFAGACAEATFSPHARDNHLADVQRTLAARAKETLPRNGTPTAYFELAGDKSRELVGYDLAAGKVLFKEPADVRSRVAVGKGRVAYRKGQNEIESRNARTGRVEATIRIGSDERFIGVTLDENNLYYVVQKVGGTKRQSHIVGTSRDGRELWRWPAQGSLGAPAAQGGVVAVPYSYQYVAFLDGATGRELSRIRALDEQILFVTAQAGGFFYGGGKGVYGLDERAVEGTRAASAYGEAKLGAEEVKIQYQVDGYQEPQSDYGAFDRNRLHWAGKLDGGKLGFAEDLVVMQAYRYLFAFEASSGRLRWAYAQAKQDVVSAALVGNELIYVTGDGELGLIDAASGQAVSTSKLEGRVLGASFDADGVTKLGGNATTPPAVDLTQMLEKIVWDPDSRFTNVKIFAVSALAAIPGTKATAALGRIVLKESALPLSVWKKAGEALVNRKDATFLPDVLAALRARPDYLEDKKSRGMDVMARVAAELSAKEAAPLVAQHLLYQDTPASALRELARALGRLGGRESVSALRDFLVTYRADPMFLTDSSALVAAAQSLLAVGGPSERRLIAYLSANRHTLPALSKALDRMLDESDEDKREVAKAAPKGEAKSAR